MQLSSQEKFNNDKIMTRGMSMTTTGKYSGISSPKDVHLDFYSEVNKPITDMT